MTPTILVYDAERVITTLYEETLTERGYDVIRAHDKGELLNTCNRASDGKLSVDAAILEIFNENRFQDELPAVLKLAIPDLPVIVNSTKEFSTKEQNIIKADAFYVKSMNMVSVIDSVERCLQ